MSPHSTVPHLSVLRMAAPLVVSFWMRAAVTFVDTVYAAMLGDSAVAAIGLTVPLEFLMIAAWVGLSTGLTSYLSRAMGAGQHCKVEQFKAIGWRLVATVSPVFTLVGAALWLVAPTMGLEPAVERGFQIYGTVLIGGSAFTTFWSIIPDSLIKAHQDTRSTMWAGITTNVLNVTLNTLFMFVFEWGLFGIALSTVVSRFGGLAYALFRAKLHEQRRKAEASDRSHELEPSPLRGILSLAIPSSITFGLMATETGLINALLARTPHPTESIAAYSIYYRMILFALQPVIATSVAMLPFAAVRVGAGDFRGIRRGLREATLATTAYSLVLVGPLMLAVAPWLADLLTESPITAEYTVFALRTVPLACLFSTWFLLCRPVFEAMQRGKPGLVMALVRYLVLTPPLALLGMWTAEQLGNPGLYGLILGTLVAAASSSVGFFFWLRLAIPPTGGNTRRAAVDAV